MHIQELEKRASSIFSSFKFGQPSARARGPAAHTPRSSLARPTMFKKILIANRGEIACRIMRTANRMGVECVAVFSEPDRNAMHVRMAQEAHCVGSAASADSYLRVDRVLDAAQKSGAQAIHPGYGFLSENAAFADAVREAGLSFIGPSAQAMRDMGAKDASKRLMEVAGVPLLPGYHGVDQSLETLRLESEKCGLGEGQPVLLKAVLGGGGKGMRIVERREDLEEAIEGARREARASFGDERLLVERYLPRARHIEVQVFCDQMGGAVSLFERDCSVQRRHQKVLEESPAPGVDAALRQQLGEAAVRAARAVDYEGAGTVEFIADAADPSRFYFMEMNTRLQAAQPPCTHPPLLSPPPPLPLSATNPSAPRGPLVPPEAPLLHPLTPLGGAGGAPCDRDGHGARLGRVAAEGGGGGATAAAAGAAHHGRPRLRGAHLCGGPRGGLPPWLRHAAPPAHPRGGGRHLRCA